MKKSYNPFTMLGSYISACIFMLLEYFRAEILTNSFLIKVISILFFPIWKIYDVLFLNNVNTIFLLILVLCYGFLIGWGINSLWRKYS